MEAPVSAPPPTKDRFYLVGIIPRTLALAGGIILFVISAVSVGIIEENEILDEVRKYGYGDVEALIIGTLSASSWLMILSGGIVIAEIVSTVLVIVNPSWPANLVLGIIEVMFDCAVILCLLTTGIPCAVYAKGWVNPPDPCSHNDEDFDCDSIGLSAIAVMQAGFCFALIGVFSSTICTSVCTIARSNKNRPTHIQTVYVTQQ